MFAAQSTEVQSLIFDKEYFDRKRAVKWAADHDFRHDKVDETDESWRLRQRAPSDFKPRSFRTISIETGVSAVIGKLKD